MMFVSGVENEDLYHSDTLVRLAEALLRLAGTVSPPGTVDCTLHFAALPVKHLQPRRTIASFQLAFVLSPSR